MRSKRKMRAFLMARREAATSAGAAEMVKVKFDGEDDSFLDNTNLLEPGELNFCLVKTKT